MKPQQIQITLDLPLWLRAKDIEKIKNIKRTKAYQLIDIINDKNEIHVVGKQVQTKHFIDHHKGYFSEEFIATALYHRQKDENNFTDSADFT